MFGGYALGSLFLGQSNYWLSSYGSLPVGSPAYYDRIVTLYGVIDGFAPPAGGVYITVDSDTGSYFAAPVDGGE